MKKFFGRQRQANYFSVRVKSLAGEFTCEQLSAIQTLAKIFGEGRVRLTSRQEIFVPFIKAENFDAVEDFCAYNDLELSPLGATLKTVTACQGCELCRAGLIDAPRVGREIERRHGGREFPAKLLIGVTGCANNCMRVELNDIGIIGGVEIHRRDDRCDFCGACEKICPVSAITINREKNFWTLDLDKCTNCGRCLKICTVAALRGEVIYKIYFGGKKFFNVRDEQTLHKIIDDALKIFSEHATNGERFGKILARLGANDFAKEFTW